MREYRIGLMTTAMRAAGAVGCSSTSLVDKGSFADTRWLRRTVCSSFHSARPAFRTRSITQPQNSGSCDNHTALACGGQLSKVAVGVLGKERKRTARRADGGRRFLRRRQPVGALFPGHGPVGRPAHTPRHGDPLSATAVTENFRHRAASYVYNIERCNPALQRVAGAGPVPRQYGCRTQQKLWLLTAVHAGEGLHPAGARCRGNTF